MAQYLIDNGYNSIICIDGTYYKDEFYNRFSHTWLVVDENIVDITADQFKYYDKPLFNDIPVYVGLKTNWYNLFEIDPQGETTHFGLKKDWVHYQKLGECYDIILKYI